MKNVGNKDDSKSRQNWGAGMNLVWNPVASMPKNDSCRLLSAENIDGVCVTIYVLNASHVDHMFVTILLAQNFDIVCM